MSHVGPVGIKVSGKLSALSVLIETLVSQRKFYCNILAALDITVSVS